MLGIWVATPYTVRIHVVHSAGAAFTDWNGRTTVTGLDPALLTYEPEHRDLTAVPRPGGRHLMARGVIGRDAEVVIECVRGIPFRLRLVDEQGKPAEGIVEYRPLSPNPQVEALIRPLQSSNW